MSAALDPDTMNRLREAGDQPIELFTLDPDEAKVCDCGAVFRRTGRARAEFRSQRWCSVSCGKKARELTGCPPRPCTHCGETIPRGPRQAIRKYKLVQFCSTTCRSARRREVAVGKASAKTCEGCGATFRRRINTENEVRFAQRRNCSQSCGAKNRQPTAGAAVKSPAKTCPVCTGLFERGPNEHAARWEARRCCSRSCAGQSRAGTGVSAPKTCAVCSVVFQRDHAVESAAHWTRKVCCSAACQETRKLARAAAKRGEAPPKPRRAASALTVVIPAKPPAVPRPIWRPGLAEDGSGDLMPGFAREVQVWGAGRRA